MAGGLDTPELGDSMLLKPPVHRKPEFVHVFDWWHLYIDCGIGTAIVRGRTMGAAWREAQRMGYTNPYLRNRVRVR